MILYLLFTYSLKLCHCASAQLQQQYKILSILYNVETLNNITNLSLFPMDGVMVKGNSVKGLDSRVDWIEMKVRFSKFELNVTTPQRCNMYLF